MEKLFTILAIALIPAVSFAKIGESMADFGALHGKPESLETVASKLSPNPDFHPEEAKQLFGDVKLYNVGTDNPDSLNSDSGLLVRN